MAIKDKFSSPANEAAGIISELSIDHHIQEEFPALASSSVTDDQNLSMSEYSPAAGIAAGQPIKFSDMFGLANYTKVKFKPGERQDYYAVQYGIGLNGTQASRTTGLNPGRNLLWSTSGTYTTTTSGSDGFDFNNPTSITDNSNINAKIPGYNRCDIKCFDIKSNSGYPRDSDSTYNLYNSHRPDVRLFIKSYDEYPIFGQEARDSNFPAYDPHWNWIKLTGKFYSRANSEYYVSNTLDTYEKSFYFHRNAAEVKYKSSTQARSESYLKYTPIDVSDFGKLIDWQDMAEGRTYYPYGKQYYQAKSGSWTAPQTISDLGDNVKSVVGSTFWGSGGDSNVSGQYFFNPSSRHDDRGGSGVHAYCWQMPYMGELGDPRGNTAAQYRAMFGNASNRVFGYHEMSTFDDEPDNEYTLEFLVDHPNSYYDSFTEMVNIGSSGDVWNI